MSGRASHKAAVEKAVVFVGVCPACGDYPDGEWSDGSEWKHWCGFYIRAIATRDKDDALHWTFDFSDDTEHRRWLASRSPQKNRRP